MKILLLLSIFINIFIGFVFAATVPGGWTSYDTNDEGVKNATAYAVEEFNKKPNGNYKYKLTKIVQAEGQVVAGINYRVKFVIGLTTCEKKLVSNNCPFAKGRKKKLQLCEATIYERPWENYMEVIDLYCRNLK
ncbi:unnamed protein product [Cunninghamella blakesleeana]